MSAFSLPVTRPSGRALLIGRQGTRQGCADAIRRLGFSLEERDDPYTAMAEIARHGAEYSAVFVMLGGLFRQEMCLIPAIKEQYTHLEVWLAQAEGRQAAIGEAMQLGADGLLTDEGLHRLAPAPAAQAGPVDAAAPLAADPAAAGFTEPILTAEELRALLQEPATIGRTGAEQ